MIASQLISFLVMGASGEANPLEWKSDLALWTPWCFSSFWRCCAKFAWKPIAAGLDKREKTIADQIAEAARANQEARDLLAEHQQKLAASGDEVRAHSRSGPP